MCSIIIRKKLHGHHTPIVTECTHRENLDAGGAVNVNAMVSAAIRFCNCNDNFTIADILLYFILKIVTSTKQEASSSFCIFQQQKVRKGFDAAISCNALLKRRFYCRFHQ